MSVKKIRNKEKQGRKWSPILCIYLFNFEDYGWYKQGHLPLGIWKKGCIKMCW